MDILTIVHFTSYALALLLLLSLPVRSAMFSKKTGSCLLPLHKPKKKLYIIVITLAIVMLVVLYFREFSLFVAIVLHGTALLAVEMGVREYLNRSKSGIYENALVVDGRVVKKAEIVVLPTLEYETDFNNTLDIVTENRGTITVYFHNAKEREDAVVVLKLWQKK